MASAEAEMLKASVVHQEPQSDSEIDGGTTHTEDKMPIPKPAESTTPPLVSSKALKLWVPQHRMSFKRAGYGVIQRAVKQLGWQKAKNDYTFAWMDRWTNADLTIVQNWRRNHFPGMSNIANKGPLARHMNRLGTSGPFEFTFVPPTFILPADRGVLMDFVQRGTSMRVRSASDRLMGRPPRPGQSSASSSTTAKQTTSLPDSKSTGQARLPELPAVVADDSDGASSDADTGSVASSTRSSGRGSTGSSTAAGSTSSSSKARRTGKAKKKKKSSKGGAKKKRTGSKSGLVFIVKPDVAAQGRGIIIETRPQRLLQWPSPTLTAAAAASSSTMGDPALASVVVQQYVPRPLTVGGHKFDLRLYCTVVSVAPTIRAFLHTEGLARFATAKYKAATGGNSKTRNMHLTNYSVNKFSTEIPEILPFSSLDTRDADTVPAMWSRVENTPCAATVQYQEAYHSSAASSAASTPRRPSATATAPPARGPVFAMAGDDRLFTHGAALDHTPLTPAGKECLAAAEREGQGGGQPEAQARGPFPRMDPFEHLRRDPVLNETTGLKWSLSSLMAVLRREYGVDTPALWRDIRNVISKTLLAIAPLLAHQYSSATASASAPSGQGLAEGSLKKKGNKGGGAPQREGGFMCYEVLGFDILLDSDLEWSVPRYGCSERHQASYTKSVQAAAGLSHGEAPPAAGEGGEADATAPPLCGGCGDMFTEGSAAGGRRIRPLLLEVNQSPSFGTDARIDEVVKQLALGDALRLASPDPIWLRKWYKRLKRWRERLAASRPGSAAAPPSSTLSEAPQSAGHESDSDAAAEAEEEEEEEEEEADSASEGGSSAPSVSGEEAEEEEGACEVQSTDGSGGPPVAGVLPQGALSAASSTYSTPNVSPRDMPPSVLGSVSQAVLKQPVGGVGGAQRLGELSGRAATEALRWAYEDFVCAAGGYQRLLPSPNPATQAYHAHLLQLVESASGLVGSSRATEARRSDALAKRKAIKEEQEKRQAMRGGGGAKPKPVRGGNKDATPRGGLGKAAAGVLQAAAAVAAVDAAAASGRGAEQTSAAAGAATGAGPTASSAKPAAPSALDPATREAAQQRTESFTSGMYGPMLAAAPSAAGSGVSAVRRSRAASLESRSSGGGSRATSPVVTRRDFGDSSALTERNELPPSDSLPTFPGSARGRLQGSPDEPPPLQGGFLSKHSPASPAGPSVRSPVKLPAPESMTTRAQGGGVAGGVRRRVLGGEAFAPNAAARPHRITTSAGAPAAKAGGLVDVWSSASLAGGGRGSFAVTPVQRVSVGQQRQRVARSKAADAPAATGAARYTPGSRGLVVSGANIEAPAATAVHGARGAPIKGRERSAAGQPMVMAINAHGLR